MTRENAAWWRWPAGWLIFTLAGAMAASFFAHFSLAFVLSLLLVVTVAVGIHAYRLGRPAQSLDVLFYVIVILGFGVVRSWISGLGIWDAVFFYTSVLTLTSATTLLVGCRQRRRVA